MIVVAFFLESDSPQQIYIMSLFPELISQCIFVKKPFGVRLTVKGIDTSVL